MGKEALLVDYKRKINKLIINIIEQILITTNISYNRPKEESRIKINIQRTWKNQKSQQVILKTKIDAQNSDITNYKLIEVKKVA